MIRTVLGAIENRELGTTLVHEHVMCDFIGAAQASKERYRAEEVMRKAEPHLRAAKQLGVSGFVDCTPMFIGRDAAVLAELSRRTGLHVLTNTGIYAAANEKYVPSYAYERSAEQLAADWLREWHDGIDHTGIKPGFIKIGVNPAALRPIEQKIVTAAALVSLQTGSAIACHTGLTATALETLDVLERRGVAPDRHIFVHAQSEPQPRKHLDYLRRGGWLELDGIAPDNAAKHLQMLMDALMAGFEDQLLLSQDAGWYWVGEPDGGKFRGYGFLPGSFVPMMRSAGITDETIDHLLVRNPANALQVENA